MRFVLYTERGGTLCAISRVMAHQRIAQSALVDDLLNSDASYFEAAAKIERVRGATIAHMDGLEALAAGCVVQRIDPANITGSATGWLDDVERRLRHLGIHHARLYLHRKAPDLEAALTRMGYTAREEIIMLRSSPDPANRQTEASLREIKTEADWAAKLALHKRMAIGPDGHPAPAELWVDMERRKCEAGYMTPYLLVIDDEVIGAANAAVCGSVLRLKNLVVVPQHRRRGMGYVLAGLLADLAAPAGKTASGVFVVAGAPFAKMYTGTGFETVAHQTEWSKDLVRS